MQWLIRLRAVGDEIVDLAGNTWKKHNDVEATDGIIGARGIGFSTGSYLRIATNEKFNLELDDYTFSAWVLDKGSPNYSCLMCRDSTYTPKFSIRLAGDFFGYVSLGGIGPVDGWYFGCTVPNAEPHVENVPFHFAVTREAGITRFFINGNLVGYNDSFKSIIMNFCNHDHDLIVGGDGYQSNSHFHGTLDDFCLIRGKALWTEDFIPPTSYLLDAKQIALSAGKAYGMKNGAFTELPATWGTLSNAEKIALFQSLDELFMPTDALRNLGKFKMAALSEKSTPKSCKIQAIPKTGIVLPRRMLSLKAYDHIKSVTLKTELLGNGLLRIAMTTDQKTYKAYDAVARVWRGIDITGIEDIKQNGMTAEVLNAIPESVWKKLDSNKIGFAYYLDKESPSDKANVDKLSFLVDMKGSWKRGIYNSDYTYEYTSEDTLQVDIYTSGDFKINYNPGKEEGA